MIPMTRDLAAASTQTLACDRVDWLMSMMRWICAISRQSLKLPLVMDDAARACGW